MADPSPGTAPAGDGWEGLAPAPLPAGDHLAVAAARCLSTPEGELLLAHLKAVTVDRVLGPAATDAQLRHLEGQRALVAHLQALIARGRG
jgi:hypothetical protein